MEYSSSTIIDTFQHTADCPGPKTVTQEVTIDDGTGKMYTYSTQKIITYNEYTITPFFSTDPIKPTVQDITQIIPDIEDLFSVVQPQGVDYDYGVDGTDTLNDRDDTVATTLTVPRTQQVQQSTLYFTGWEIKTAVFSLDVLKTNIIPTACNSLQESCYTVPIHSYTSSCSSDIEDELIDLTVSWELYFDLNSTVEIDIQDNKTVIHDENNADWELDDSIQQFTFNKVYSREGQYKLIESVEDTDGGIHTNERSFPITFIACDSDIPAEEQTVQASGIIEIESNAYSLVSIPMTTGYWSTTEHKIVKDKTVKSTVKNTIIDQIEDVYGVQAETLISALNAYSGDSAFFNYLPGRTPETSIHNFPLVETDADDDLGDSLTKFEIAGMWIKNISASAIKIKWGVIE